MVYARLAHNLASETGREDYVPTRLEETAEAAKLLEQKTDITFGGKLRLVGYDIIDNTEWRQTGVRLYWQALEPLLRTPASAASIARGQARG